MEIKKSPVKTTGAVVAHVEHPVFDEKNPTIGLQEILSFDWKGVGYNSAEHAIVSLVNTQHATNLKNEARAKASGKVTGEKLNQLAMQALATLPPDELGRLAADPNGIVNWVNAKKEELKQVAEKERTERLAALVKEQDDEGGEQE
jgi:hypothetical protein